MTWGLQADSVKQSRSGRPRYSTFRLGRKFKGSGGAQLFRRDCGTGADVLQQGGLIWFKIHQAAQHVQDVDELRGVFREPGIGLNGSQRRWFTSVSDDGALRLGGERRPQRQGSGAGSANVTEGEASPA